MIKKINLLEKSDKIHLIKIYQKLKLKLTAK